MIPTLTGSRLVLAVQDLQQSAAFYKDQLAFNTVWEGGGWHFLSREQVCIMIGECPDDLPAFELGSHSYVAYFEVKNIDGLYREYLLKEVEILSEPVDQPWGQREFSIRTIDGHRIMFGEAIGSDSN
jgi:catechol 2,3-dioxygenase-like lactoylglutathione lyase family enzyme